MNVTDILGTQDAESESRNHNHDQIFLNVQILGEQLGKLN